MKFFEIVDRIDPVDFFNSFDEEDYYIDKVKADFGVEDIILAKRAKYCEKYLGIVGGLLDNPSPDRKTKKFLKHIKKVLKESNAYIPLNPNFCKYSELERICVIVEGVVGSFC